MEGMGVERWFVVGNNSNLQVCFGGRLSPIAHIAVNIRRSGKKDGMR
jgi:hypothetical protein